MSDVLSAIARDATCLKDSVIGARAAGELREGEAQSAITACARLLQIVKAAMHGESAGVSVARATVEPGPLSEFIRWPSSAMPCPKCGGTKPRFTDYVRPTKMGDESMRHVCRCGYCIYTKPLDASPGAQVDGDDFDWSNNE